LGFFGVASLLERPEAIPRSSACKDKLKTSEIVQIKLHFTLFAFTFQLFFLPLPTERQSKPLPFNSENDKNNN